MREPPPWTEDEFRMALDHGLQQEALERVTNLLSALRDAKTADQLWNMQVELLQAVLWAQEYKSRSKRYLERSKRHKPIPEVSQAGSWDLEHRIASRVERQIRSVGDCLAWKVLSCRRDVLFVLSQNQSPGSIYGKEGLKAEAEIAEAHWAKGHFALLNDLTQSVRIGDLIVLTPEGPQLSEVKTDASRHRTEQRNRIRRALQTLNRERPLDIAGQPHEIFRARTQLKTRMECLGAALDQARANGFGSFVIEPGWLVVATSVSPAQHRDDVDERHEQAKQQASIVPGQHVLQTLWSWRAWDYQDVLVAGVPFGAFPLDARVCAELTCGYSMFRVYLRADVVDRELKRVGFGTQWSFPAAGSTLDPLATILMVLRPATYGRRGMTVSPSAFGQSLYELLVPRRYAQALREMFDWSATQFPARPMAGKDRLLVGRGTMAFSNEKAVWFKKPARGR